MKKKKINTGLNPVLSQEKFHYRWISAALALILWSLLEELILSSSDLVTNFFANQIHYGENQSLLNFVNEANNHIKEWGSEYINHLYSVGQIDVNGLAAATQIYTVVMSVLFGFCYGIGVYTAQYFGARKYQHLRDLVMFKIQFSVLISLIFIFLILFFGDEMIGFIIKYQYIPKPEQTASPEEWIKYYDSQASLYSIQQGTKYIKIVCGSYAILAIELALVTTLRETGRPMVSFWASFSTFFITVMFLVFLVEPTFLSNFRGFGLLGCAYSVILGKIIQNIFLLIFIFWKKYEFIPNRFWHINKYVAWVSFKKSIFVTFNELLWSFSMLMQVKLLAINSLETLTANAIVSTLVSILVVPTYHGISAGIAVLVGNNLGNNKLKIAEINSKRLIGLTFLMGIFISLLLGSFSFVIGDIFSNTSEEIIELAKKFLWIYAAAVTVLILNGTLYSIIRAGGLVYTAFAMDSIYNWCVTIPLMAGLILGTNMDIVYIFILIRIAEILKLGPSLYFYFKKKWVKNLVYKL